MKNFMFVIISLLLMSVGPMEISASNEVKKSRIEQKKELRKSLDQKVSKSSKKLAKQKIKEKWIPFGSSKTIEEQLERVRQYEEENEDGESEYLTASSVGIANTREAAQAVARRNAQLQLIKALETEGGEFSEGGLHNRSLSDSEVSTSSDTDASNQLFSHNVIKKAKTIYEVYRKTDNGKYEVEVTLALRIATIKEELKEQWIQESKAKDAELREKLQNKLNN